MKNRNLKHKDDWATPPDFLDKIRREFGSFFDPCPWQHNIEDWDGLKVEWGDVNFINPPYSLELKKEFVINAVHRSFTGVKCIMLLPVSTSTKLFHGWVKPYSSKIDFVEGRLRFIGRNDKGQYVNYDQIQTITKETIDYGGIEIPKFIKSSGMHDSMLVIF